MKVPYSYVYIYYGIGIGIDVYGNPNSNPIYHDSSSASASDSSNDMINQEIAKDFDTNVKSSSLIFNRSAKSFDIDAADQCPLSLKLTYTNNLNNGATIIGTPTMFPFIGHRAGRQVVFTAFSDHLEFLQIIQNNDEYEYEYDGGSNSRKFSDFPLLFEGSTFYGSPVVHDIDGDGIEEVITIDFDGRGIIVKLNNGDDDDENIGDKDKNEEKRHSVFQVPRLFVRKDWMNGTISSTNDHHPDQEEERRAYNEPFHSYFEWEGEWAEKRKEALQKEGRVSKRRRLLVVDDPAGRFTPESYETENKEVRVEHGNILMTPDPDRAVPEGNNKIVQTVAAKRDNEDTSMVSDKNYIVANLHDGEPKNSIVSKSNYINANANINSQFEKLQKDEQTSPQVKENLAIIEEYLQNHKDEVAKDPMMNKILASKSDEDITADDKNVVDDVWNSQQSNDSNDKVDLDDNSDPGMNDDGMRHAWDGEYPYDDMQAQYHDDYYAYQHHHDDGYFDEENYVALDPHVLSSPHIAIVDSQPSLFVSVSYFFEEKEYEHMREEHLPVPLDEMKNYASSAILRYSFRTKRWVNEEHLDLSSNPTSNVKRRALTYCTPTVVDLDGDSHKEVIVGSSFGLLYVMSMYGVRRDGFPIQMGEITAQVSVADVVGSPDLELFAVDLDGNILCLNASGDTIWHQNVGAAINKSAKLGDLNGDGKLEVVVISAASSSTSGSAFKVWAFDASSGEIFPNFPFLIGEDENSPSALQPEVLLVDLHENQKHWLSKNFEEMASRRTPASHGGYGRGLHIVLPANRFLYFIEGSTGCINRINVGENIRNMVLAGDMIGNGNLSLLTSTMNGEILTFETPLEVHPLNTWTSPLRSRLNGFIQGYSSPIGIVVNDKSSDFRDILGFVFPVTFKIFDKRDLPNNYKRRYTVCIGIGTSQQKLRFTKEYNSTGVFTERITLPEGGKYSTIVVSLTTEHGLYFEETFTVGYNVNFGKGIEWLLALPMVLAAIPLILYRRNMTLEGGSLLGTTVNENHWRRAD